jgi:hypothetical protein
MVQVLLDSNLGAYSYSESRLVPPVSPLLVWLILLYFLKHELPIQFSGSESGYLGQIAQFYRQNISFAAELFRIHFRYVIDRIQVRLLYQCVLNLQAASVFDTAIQQLPENI